MPSEKLIELFVKITNGNAVIAVISALYGTLYLVMHFVFPTIFPIDYIYVVTFLGSLIGIGVSSVIKFAFKQNPDPLKELSIQEAILERKISVLRENIELGLIEPSKGRELHQKLVEDFLLNGNTQPPQLRGNLDNEQSQNDEQ